MSAFDKIARRIGKKGPDETPGPPLELLNDPVSCCQFGEKLLKDRKPGLALQFFSKAVELDSKSAHGWFGQGMALIQSEDFAESLACFRKVIRLDPKLAIAHANLGRCLHETGQADLAFQSFRRALSLNFTPVLQNLAVTIPGIPCATNKMVLSERKKWARQLERTENARPYSHTVNVDKRSECLKIGYVSAFFHKENWMKPVWALLGQHDREKFQVHLFSDRTGLTPEIARVLRAEDEFHDISGLSNEQAAELVHDEQVDILIDLNGYSYPPRFPLFLRKPAPLTVGWFNMYATTGFDCFDYLVGDDCVIPQQEERFYSEKIVRVPGSYLTFSVDYHVPDLSEPPCVANGYVTFGSLISQYKVTDQVIDAWCRILRNIPDASMLIRNAGMAKASNREYLLSQFEKKGINPKRISIEGPADHFEFLETYNRIDIALDAFPYNGGTTTTEALWQGVPVVSWWGDRWVSRTSATLLRCAGLADLVANDVPDYVRLATDLAADVEGLKVMRENMRERLLQSKVCDTGAFAKSMEDIYQQIWQSQKPGS